MKTHLLNDANFIVDNVEGGDFYMDNIDYEDQEMVDKNAIKQDDYTDVAYDQYVGAELLLPHGDEMVQCSVIKHAHGKDGNPIGKHNANPILDTKENKSKCQMV